ncbi:Tyrosine-protein phosphatase non-receptor type 9 [Aix galericulata]|nr:Tyrosine-protein phosphatase non-receptor type 9 [Aix galericulata]
MPQPSWLPPGFPAPSRGDEGWLRGIPFFSSFFKSSRWRWGGGSGRNGGCGRAVAAGGSPWSWWARNGLVFIYDMAGSQYTNFELDLSKKILNLLKGAFPARLKKVFIVGAPMWFRVPYSIISLLLKEKLRERVSVSWGVQPTPCRH